MAGGRNRTRATRGAAAPWAPGGIALGIALGMAMLAAVVGGAVTTLSSMAGGGSIVSVAKAEYDRGEADGTSNAGGAKYWQFAGFSGRVAWCGCFVGYCASQAGLVPGQNMPDGYPLALSWATWYSAHPDQGTVHARGDGYKPQAGDIAVRGDMASGVSHHVGIVEKVDDSGCMWTYEGNSGDATAHREWPAGPDNSNWDYYVHITCWPRATGTGDWIDNDAWASSYNTYEDGGGTATASGTPLDDDACMAAVPLALSSETRLSYYGHQVELEYQGRTCAVTIVDCGGMHGGEPANGQRLFDITDGACAELLGVPAGRGLGNDWGVRKVRWRNIDLPDGGEALKNAGTMQP